MPPENHLRREARRKVAALSVVVPAAETVRREAAPASERLAVVVHLVCCREWNRGPGPKRPKRREAQRRLCTNGPGRACDGLQTPQQYYACRPPTVSRRKLRDRASARQDYEAGSSRNYALLRPATQFGSHGNGRLEWFAVTEFRPLLSVPLAANSSFGVIVFARRYCPPKPRASERLLREKVLGH